MNNSIYGKIIFVFFMAILVYYTFSKHNIRYTERKRLSNLDDSRICYLFAPSYFQIASINNIPSIPLNRSEYAKFKNINKKIKVYKFEYNNLLELEFQYSRERLFRKSISSGNLKMNFKINPRSIYFISEKNIEGKELDNVHIIV